MSQTVDFLLRFYCSVTFGNRNVPGVQQVLTNQGPCKGNGTDAVFCVLLYCYAYIHLRKQHMWWKRPLLSSFLVSPFNYVFAKALELCGLKVCQFELGKGADVHQVKSQTEITLHSPVQQLISLTLTELLEAWEAPIEIILISGLRQGGRRFGGR